LQSLWARLVFLWRTRKMNRKEQVEFAFQEMEQAALNLKEGFKDEPATRELIDAFNSIDRIVEEGRAFAK
jgi:hypothetical protein